MATAAQPANTTANKAAASATSAKPAKTSRRATAESMAKGQREISISEFFAKNRHLLGFDNPRKALLTTVKEAVDNALDACEEAGILPTITVELHSTGAETMKVRVRDNGPGIVEKNIRNVFGKLLYGSKFHRLRMSRGQQGIGISAAGMYGLMTTGQPVRVVSKIGKKKPAHYCELKIDTRKNEAVIVKSEDDPGDGSRTRGWLNLGPDSDPLKVWPHGTQVEIELKANYIKGRQSVDEYVRQTAIANPHAEFFYRSPAGGIDHYPRGTDELPAEPTEIKPHPYGIELGTLLKMAHEARQGSVGKFLQESFSQVSPTVAKSICNAAKVNMRGKPAELSHKQIDALYNAIQQTKIKSPPTDCLVPIGGEAIRAGLIKGISADFYTSVQRPANVYRGNPFLIEVGIAFGGELGQFIGKDDQPDIDADVVDKTRRKKKKAEESSAPAQAQVLRFANRVPLQYQAGACSITKSVLETKWANYGLSQARGALPTAPLMIMVHIASVWVPFTSESKEAVADYDEIRKEIKRALQEAGRKLSVYINRRNQMRREEDRRNVFRMYISEVVQASKALDPSIDEAALTAQLTELARRKTEVADTQFDEDGKVVRGSALDDDDVVIVRDADGSETAQAAYAKAIRRGDTKKAAALKDAAEAEAAAEAAGDEGGSDASDSSAAQTPADEPEGHEHEADAATAADAKTQKAAGKRRRGDDARQGSFAFRANDL